MTVKELKIELEKYRDDFEVFIKNDAQDMEYDYMRAHTVKPKSLYLDDDHENEHVCIVISDI